MSTMCGIVDHYDEARNVNRGAYWLYDDNRSGDNPQVSCFPFLHPLCLRNNNPPPPLLSCRSTASSRSVTP